MYGSRGCPFSSLLKLGFYCGSRLSSRKEPLIADIDLASTIFCLMSVTLSQSTKLPCASFFAITRSLGPFTVHLLFIQRWALWLLVEKQIRFPNTSDRKTYLHLVRYNRFHEATFSSQVSITYFFPANLFRLLTLCRYGRKMSSMYFVS